MDRSKAVMAQLACVAVAAVLYLIAKVADIGVLYVLAFVPLTAAVVFACFDRCPYCGHSLFRHHMFIEYCPYCGNPL